MPGLKEPDRGAPETLPSAMLWWLKNRATGACMIRAASSDEGTGDSAE